MTEAGVTDVVVMDRTVISAVFDDDTDTWTLNTRGGEICRGRVVIAGSPFVPWIAELAGRDDFRGPVFHAAAPDRQFDPAGQCVAVIGADASAGQFIERVARSAASVTVFPLPPRRVVCATRRWRRRPSPQVVTSPIDAVTASGIRTRDGAHYDVDAIVCGTGLTVADRDATLIGARGLTIRQAWRDGMEPYLGIAVHGFPNYFLIDGPDNGARRATSPRACS